jgi:hypothetical protein
MSANRAMKTDPKRDVPIPPVPIPRLSTSRTHKLLQHAVLALFHSDMSVAAALAPEREVVFAVADLNARGTLLLAKVIPNERGTDYFELGVLLRRLHSGIVGFLATAVATCGSEAGECQHGEDRGDFEAVHGCIWSDVHG